MKRMSIIFDGNNFSDIESFYNEVTRVFNPVSGVDGRNLDALQDLLWGGMGLHEFKQPIEIHWLNSTKSRKDFGYFNYRKLVKTMRQVPHVNVSLE